MAMTTDVLNYGRRFNHRIVDLGYNDLKAETGPKYRQYTDPKGNKYYSITTCLSILSEEAIAKWRARVGEEEANRISSEASTRGTRVHEILEAYVNNEEDYMAKKETFQDEFVFNQIKPEIDKNLTEVWGQECALYSEHLGVAGRVDLVGVWNGQPSIIDWKTSKKEKKEEWIKGYYMQATAYAIMWEERTGIPITQLVVAIAGDRGPQIFVSHRDKWDKQLVETINEFKRRQMWPNQRK